MLPPHRLVRSTSLCTRRYACTCGLASALRIAATVISTERAASSYGLPSNTIASHAVRSLPVTLPGCVRSRAAICTLFGRLRVLHPWRLDAACCGLTATHRNPRNEGGEMALCSRARGYKGGR